DRSHPHADYCGWSAGAGEASMALILQTLSPDRRMGALANGQQVVKSFRYHLTDPRQFDIMQSGPCLGGPNAIRSIEAPRVHIAPRRRNYGVAARCARAQQSSMPVIVVPFNGRGHAAIRSVQALSLTVLSP